MTETTTSTSARRWLAVGAAIGLLAALAGIVRPGPRLADRTPEGAAAVVEGAVIEEAAFERAVELLAADARNPIGAAERTHVLNRLIEEELLVQRARELEVDEHDRRVRSLLVSSMIDSIVADAQPEEPSQTDVEEFFSKNGGYFARTDRIHVEPLRFAKRDGEEEADVRLRAQKAAARLRAGEKPNLVQDDLADSWIIPVPRGLLPAAKLREYLGPTPTRSALELEEGMVGNPVKGGRTWYVLRMVDREPGRIPSLAEVKDEVRAEMLRRAGDHALRAYLDQLRERASVWVQPGLAARTAPP